MELCSFSAHPTLPGLLKAGGVGVAWEPLFPGPPQWPAPGLWGVRQEALAEGLALGSAPCSRHPHTSRRWVGRGLLSFFREEKGIRGGPWLCNRLLVFVYQATWWPCLSCSLLSLCLPVSVQGGTKGDCRQD